MTALPQDPPWLDLTLAQLDFWEEFRFHPERPISTVAHCITLEGALDEPVLIGALEQLAQETEVLALRFRDGPGGPRQQIDPARRPRLRYHDLRYEADPESDPEAVAHSMMQRDIARPIDLEHDPIAALWLLRVGAERWLWYLRGHHIALDGYGVSLIERRAAALYAQALGKETDPGPFLPFTHYLEEEEAYRASRHHARDREHWRHRLAAGPRLTVLQKGAEDYACTPLSCAPEVPPALCAGLCATAEAAGLGWPDLLTLLSAAWLARDLPAGGPGLPVWLPYMSRLGSVAAAIPALVVNILPLIVTRAADETLAAYLARTGAELRQLRRHGRCRIEQLAADQGLGPGERFFFSPLINLLPFDPPQFTGCRARREVLAAGPGDGFNLTWGGAGDGSGLGLWIDADPGSADHFDQASRGLVGFVARACAPGALACGLDALLCGAAQDASAVRRGTPASPARPIAGRLEQA